MIWIALVFAVVGAGFSIWLCVNGSKTPLTIKFSYMPLDWFIPILSSIPCVMLSFAIEYIISEVIAPINVDKTSLPYVFIRAYENGLFIPLLGVVVSWLFYNSVRSLHLQYLPHYSDTVPKVCFTVIVLTFCVVLKIGVLDKYQSSDAEYDLMLNRILMWALTVLGTWVGFGFGCKSQEEKVNEIIQDSNEEVTFTEKLKFWAPIVGALVISVLIMFVSISSILDEFFVVLFSFALSFLVFGSITLTIIMRKKNPSKSRSAKLFVQAKSSHRKTGLGEGQFGELFYSLDKDKLIIKPRIVIYEGHQDDDEFKKLFCEDSIQLGETEDKYEDAWRALNEKLTEQENYIKRKLEACVNEASDKKRVKFK